MKRYLLWIIAVLLYFTFSTNAKAQVITSLTIQYSQPGISNNIEVIAQVGIPYIPGRVVNSSNWVSNDTLYLTACYYSGFQATPILVTDTFQVGNLNPGTYKLYFEAFLTNTWSHCDSSSFTTRTQGFTVSNLLGRKPEQEKPELLIFPNPTKNFVFVENQGQQNLILRDLTGKIIRRSEFQQAGNLKLDLTSLRNGVYLLELKNKDGKAHFRRIMKE